MRRLLVPFVLALSLIAPTAAARDVPGLPLPPTESAGRTTKVVVVSLDGLGSIAVRRLGAERSPTLHRLMEEGASTLDARTERELTLTLPNHTGMVTGRRIDADHGGHGVTWNDERLRPRTVHGAAGHDVSSVFREVDSDERDPGLFVSKPKLSLFKRSWSSAIDRFVVREDNAALTKVVRRDLREHRRALTFVHLSGPDDAGHEHGFLSPEYLDAAERTDALLGRIVDTIESRPRLARHTTLVVTADHGGKGATHYDPRKAFNFRIPFVVWGANVASGADLYELNDDYREPGSRRTRYGAKKPPVRNGDVANLVTRLLGLGRVPGSEFGVGVRLDVQ